MSGAIEARYPEMPWSSLDGAALAPPLQLAVRRFWSDNARSELGSASAMAGLAAALRRAGVEPELAARASRCREDELVHAELCEAVAARAGGVIGTIGAIGVIGADAERARADEPTSLADATVFAVRVLCLGEAVSLRLLAGNLRASQHPLARAVLARIVRDEAAHARFGWAYLDWAAPRLAAAERGRLGELLARDLAALAPILHAPPSGAPACGFGWMAAERWHAVMRRALDLALLRPLARYGIAPSAVTR